MIPYADLVAGIKSIMKVKGIDRLQDLAARLDIKPSTLTNNLKYLAKHENYESTFARKVYEVLSIDEQQLKNALNDHNTPFNTSHLKLLDNKANAFRPLHNSYHQEIFDLLTNLSKGDTYTLVTTDFPIEFKDESFRNTILQCLKAGVVFRYVFPNPKNKELEGFLNQYWSGFFPHWKYLGEQHAEFIQHIKQEVAEDDDFKEIPGFSIKGLEAQLKYYYSDDPLLMHPMFKFMLLDKDVLGESQKHVFIEASVGMSFSSVSSGSFKFWYPSPHLEAQTLAKNIENSISPQ